jgi:hypothetical protein
MIVKLSPSVSPERALYTNIGRNPMTNGTSTGIIALKECNIFEEI